jgi:uncharacterized protein YndB with AHSA1/START domain
MPRSFELHHDLTVGATPEQVWDALTDGPKLDSWFMGRNEVEGGEGGRVTTTFSGYASGARITTWQPPTRLELRTDVGDDGSFHTFEYIVEATGDGSAVRWNHSGVLGDDWEIEYAGMSEGDPMYFNKLAEYLTYFPGRVGIPIDGHAPGPFGDDPTWGIFLEPLGLTTKPGPGDPVHLTLDGIGAIEGVVDHLSPSFFGVRTDDAMYRFIRGFEGSAFIGHHLFADDLDATEAQAAWRSWMTRSFS